MKADAMNCERRGRAGGGIGMRCGRRSVRSEMFVDLGRKRECRSLGAKPAMPHLTERIKKKTSIYRHFAPIGAKKVRLHPIRSNAVQSRINLYFVARYFSIACVTASLSGLSFELNLATMLPFLSIRNLLKFQVISPPNVGFVSLLVR